MTSDSYLAGILVREFVDSSPASAVWAARNRLLPMLSNWGGSMLLGVSPSGSFAKGTANRSGTDLDLFISLSPDTRETLREVYESLHSTLSAAGLKPRRQNVSIGVRIGDVDVDLVPGKRQSTLETDHSLYRSKADTWTKTNVQTHIDYVRGSGRQQEIRLIKLWRNQKGLSLPSFYLELAVIRALAFVGGGSLADRVWHALGYLATDFERARFVDPANTNNVVSDDLSASEKAIARTRAQAARAARTWEEIIK